MGLPRLALIGIALILVVGVAGALVLNRGGEPAVTPLGFLGSAPNGDRAVLEERLLESGLPTGLASVFGTVETQLVTASAARVHYVQRIPALGSVRETIVTFRHSVQLARTESDPLETALGFQVHPVGVYLAAVPGAHGLGIEYFIPYDTVPPALRDVFGPRVAGAFPGATTHPIGLARTQSPSMLGVMVQSTVAVLDGSATGINPAKAGAPAGAYDEARALEDLVTERSRLRREMMEADRLLPATPEEIQARQAIIRQFQGEIDDLNAYLDRIGQSPEAMRRSHELAQRRLQLLQDFERERQNACRAATSELNLGRLGAGLEAAAIAAELYQTYSDVSDGNDYIDAYEAAAAGNSGDPIADALARRAQTEDPLGTQLTAERAATAREDMYVTAGARVLNTGLSAVVTVMTGGIGGLIVGPVSAGNDALLSGVHDQIVNDLATGGAQPVPPWAQDVIRNAQNPGPTTRLGTAPGFEGRSRIGGSVQDCEDLLPNQAIGAGQAGVVLNATESDGRTITFQSTVRLTQDLLGIFNQEFSGKSTGFYREQFTSEQCSFTITWSGQVDMEIVARLSTRDVEVGIAGPVTQAGEFPGRSCLDGVYYAPHGPHPARLGYSCRWDNVDFVRGGVFRGPPPEESPDPNHCTLNIGPLVTPTPTSAR